MAQQHQVGQRLSYDGVLCTVRYVGEVAGTSGSWLGVEWDDPSRGKHDGRHKDVRYFSSKSKAPTAASFVRPTRPADKPLGFVAALHRKYASGVAADQTPIQPKGGEIVISGKVAEEVGFDKIRRRLAQLHDLRIVILDGMRVASAAALPTDQAGQAPKSIKEVSPIIMELDLSRNLFTRFATVVEACGQLALLRSLKLNGNRFEEVLEDESLHDAERAFKGVKELWLDETLLSWEEICHVTASLASLSALYAGTNQLSSLSPIPPSPITATLTSLNLEYNDFASLTDIASLAALASLRNLHLKGNNIVKITADPSVQAPVFGPGLVYLDISYNRVADWSFADALPASFPGLTSLRFAHNPIYDSPAFDSSDSSAAAEGRRGGDTKATVTEEAYMITLARVPTLTALNFSAISAADRTNAEMFYLSRIARQLGGLPDGGADEARVLASHRRWAELCEAYGEPAVSRRLEGNPNFLEARLVSVELHMQRASAGSDDDREDGAGEVTAEMGGTLVKKVQIPKSFDIYAVKGIAGRLFGHPPPGLRLIWETGEWDPVAGFDEEVGDSSDEDEEDGAVERVRAALGADDQGGRGGKQQQQQQQQQEEKKAGKWVKREVELRDGPRQFGFCVDGLEAKIRVELR